MILYRQEFEGLATLSPCGICDGSGTIPRETRHHGTVLLPCPCSALHPVPGEAEEDREARARRAGWEIEPKGVEK